MSGAATVFKCNQVGDHLACLGLIEPPDDPRTVYFHFWIARLDQKLMGEVSMLELPATVFYGGLQRGGEFLHSVSIHSQQHGIVAEIEPGGELNANGAHASPKKRLCLCWHKDTGATHSHPTAIIGFSHCGATSEAHQGAGHQSRATADMMDCDFA